MEIHRPEWAAIALLLYAAALALVLRWATTRNTPPTDPECASRRDQMGEEDHEGGR